MMKQTGKQRILLIAGVAMLLLLSAVCFGLAKWLTGLLASQKEAERWRGESEMAFSQISCFLPVDELIGLREVSTFRSEAMKKLREASLETSGDRQLMLDAWSTTTKLYTSGEHGRGEASVIAVGGNYFDFHPLRLLGGDYIRQTDLMQDRILLSEEVAWMLFGGTDLQGLTMKLNGVPFSIAGVVEQEKDFASKKASSGSLDLYMSYEGLLQLNENAKISCYEFVMAEPVRGFALNVAKTCFPIGRGEILCNTTRYEYGNLMKLMLQFSSRGVQTSGAVLPYWENAARRTENLAGLCCMWGTIFLVLPCLIGLAWTVRAVKRGKTRLAEEGWPQMRERIEEAIRIRQRRRWEKRHGRHEQL